MQREIYQIFEFSADLGVYPVSIGLPFIIFFVTSRHSAPHRSKV
jgi:hypothetical protein